MLVFCDVCFLIIFFFFKQKTAYEMRISDWSSDVCSSDLRRQRHASRRASPRRGRQRAVAGRRRHGRAIPCLRRRRRAGGGDPAGLLGGGACHHPDRKRVVQGKSVSVRVALGGGRIITKKNQNINHAKRGCSHKNDSPCYI